MSDEEVKLINAEDKVIHTMRLSLRYKDQAPRSLIYQGKRYIEGGAEGSFYGFGEFAEARGA